MACTGLSGHICCPTQYRCKYLVTEEAVNIATVSKAIPRRVSTTPAGGCSRQSVSICVRIPVPLIHLPFRSNPVQKICFQNIYLISMQKGSTGITGMENIPAETPAHLRRARLVWEVMQGACPSICSNILGKILGVQEITETCTVSGAPSTHPSGISVGEKGWMQHHHRLQTPEIQQGPVLAEGMGMGPVLKVLSPALSAAPVSGAWRADLANLEEWE